MPTVYFSDEDHDKLRGLADESAELTGRRDSPADVVMDLVRLYADEHLRRLRVAAAITRGQEEKKGTKR